MRLSLRSLHIAQFTIASGYYILKIIKIPNNLKSSSACFILVHSIIVTQFFDYTVTTGRSIVKIVVTDGNFQDQISTISNYKSWKICR